MARFARLKKEWLLRGWNDVPTALVNWATGEQRELSRTAFYVASSCDGRTDFDSLSFLADHHAVLERLMRDGVVEACPEGNPIETCQRYRKADNPRLTGIHWCLTGLCNLNCRHCYMEAPAGRYGELPFRELERLVGQFKEANVVEVLLTGGEPFLRKDVLRIIALLAEKKIRISEIYTNGLLVTDAHLDAIVRTGFAPVFQISFDGVGAGGHDRMRGARGIEGRVIDAIRRVRAARFPVVVSTSIDKMSMGRLLDTYELMKELEIESWVVAPPQELGNWKGSATATTLDEEAEACIPVLGRWRADGRPFNIQLAVFFRGARAKESPAAPHRKARAEPQETANFTPDSYDCGACREQPNLMPDGTLIPCPGYVESSLYRQMPNLLRQDLSSAWRASLLRRVADMKKKDLFASNQECESCELFSECGLGCRASALRRTGDLMAKDPVFCELWKKGYKRRFRQMALSPCKKGTKKLLDKRAAPVDNRALEKFA